MWCAVVLMSMLQAAYCAPADGPVRVDLPVYDDPQSSSAVQLAQPLQSENHPGDQPRIANGGGIVSNLISQKVQAANSVLSHTSQGSAGVFGVFANPVRHTETALPETEGWGSQVLSVKENIQGAVAGVFQPKPIVDTIREEEKYGNSGDKFYAAGNAVVGAASGVSNLINSALEVPKNIFKQIAQVATEKLNNFGGKLVGLN